MSTSTSSRKRRHRRETLRIGNKRFRAAEKRALHGEHPRGVWFSPRWGQMGPRKANNLPLDEM